MKHDWLIIPILIVAAALRLFGNDWDDYQHYHPDERYISFVAVSIEWPDSWRTAFHPHRSTFNPFYWNRNDATKGIVIPQDEQRTFAYGHVPLYLGVIATRVLERFDDSYVEYDHVVMAGRVLSALADVGTVFVLFLLGRKLFDTKTGLLAALFLSLAVIHIQSAHFFIADPFLTFFVVTAIYLMLIGLPSPSPSRREGDQTSLPSGGIEGGRPVWIAAIFVGLAVGSKFSAILLGLPLLVVGWRTMRWRVVWVLVVAAVTFALTNPFVFLDWTCEVVTEPFWIVPSIDWKNCFLLNVGTQSSMVSGASVVPYVRQYIGTMPFVYPAEMLLKWGLGYPLGIVALLSIVWSLICVVRNDEKRWMHIVVLLWMIPFGLSTGRFFVKFMRYLLPLIPFLLLYGAAMVMAIRSTWVRRVVMGVVVGWTAVYALAFVNIYREPHPWLVASVWIFENVAPDATIVTEVWGDRLPDGMIRDGEVLSSKQYQYAEVNWLSFPLEMDDEVKLMDNLTVLAESDYYVIDSNRSWGVVSRLPAYYPISSAFYAPLFAGELGYELIFAAERSPRISDVVLRPNYFAWPQLTRPEQLVFDGWTIDGGRFDESFTLYDQSLTMIFVNVGGLTAEQMRSVILE